MFRVSTLAVTALVLSLSLFTGCESMSGSNDKKEKPKPTVKTEGNTVKKEADVIGDKIKEGTEEAGAAVKEEVEAVKDEVAGKKAEAKVIASKAPGDDAVAGTVTFTETPKGIAIHAEITGLKPGKHGFHIHEKGDLADPEFKSAGPHFNPGKGAHGDHAGDLGNLVADDKGKAVYTAVLEDMKFDNSETGIIGRSIIIHEKEDDGKTDPSGNSGARIGGGVIELKK